MVHAPCRAARMRLGCSTYVMVPEGPSTVERMIGPAWREEVSICARCTMATYPFSYLSPTCLVPELQPFPDTPRQAFRFITRANDRVLRVGCRLLKTRISKVIEEGERTHGLRCQTNALIRCRKKGNFEARTLAKGIGICVAMWW